MGICMYLSLGYVTEVKCAIFVKGMIKVKGVAVERPRFRDFQSLKSNGTIN